MSDKLKKILAVVFLTLLIWAWAYMSLAKSETFVGTLEVSPAADPGLLVTLTLPKSNISRTEIPLTSLNFNGAPSRISDLSKKNKRPLNDENREPLDFYYDPARHGNEAGDYSLSILDYLKNSQKVKDLALALESCAPTRVDVKIEQLEEKKLPIQCLKEDGSVIKEAVITPAFANIYVRKGYDGPASVTLTQQQINNARNQQPVAVTPYVELGVAGVTRKSAEPVEVVLESETLLRPRSFEVKKPIGILMSQELQNAYKVTILNEQKMRETLSVYATEEAFRAYEKVAYPLYIIIKDSDVADLSKIPPKTIYYNFPPEYVKSGQIEQDETKLPRRAEIEIEPLTP